MNPSTQKVIAPQLIEPLYIVAAQLNVLTADGTATSIVMIEKTRPE